MLRILIKLLALSGLACLYAGGTFAQTASFKEIPLADSHILISEPVFGGSFLRARNYDVSSMASMLRYQSVELARNAGFPYTAISFQQLAPDYQASARVLPGDAARSFVRKEWDLVLAEKGNVATPMGTFAYQRYTVKQQPSVSCVMFVGYVAKNQFGNDSHSIRVNHCNTQEPASADFEANLRRIGIRDIYRPPSAQSEVAPPSAIPSAPLVPPPTPQSSTTLSPAGQPAGSVEERLARIKDLVTKGLITEAEASEQRRRILEGI